MTLIAIRIENREVAEKNWASLLGPSLVIGTPVWGDPFDEGLKSIEQDGAPLPALKWRERSDQN